MKSKFFCVTLATMMIMCTCLTACADGSAKDTGSATESVVTKSEVDEVDIVENAVEDSATTAKEVTAQSLIEAYRDGLNDRSGTIKGKMEFGMSMKALGESSDMQMSADMVTESANDMSHSVINMTTKTDDEEEHSVSETYMEKQDGQYIVYSRSDEDSAWVQYTASEKDVEGFASSIAELEDDSFVLKEDGNEYVVTGEIDLASASEAVNSIIPMDELTESMGGSSDIDLSGLSKAKIEYHFDKDTGDVRSCSVDMQDAMQDMFDRLVKEMFGQLLAGDATDGGDTEDIDFGSMFEFKISSFKIEMNGFDFDTGVKIEIPEEAKSANSVEDPDSDGSSSEVASGVTGTAEGSWMDMTGTFDSMDFTMPFHVSDFMKNGWEFEDSRYSEGYILNAGDETYSTLVLKKDGNDGYLMIGARNSGKSQADIKDCEVSGFDYNAAYSDDPVDFLLKSGARFGMSLDEVQALYGDPQESYVSDSGDYAEMTYGSSWESAFDGKMVRFSFTDDALTGISMHLYD